MQDYDIVCILIILTLVHFAGDYLSDKKITHSETKLGILIFIHHLLCVFMCFGSIICLLFSKSIILAFIIIAISTVIQSGFLINNDYCWLTVMINNLIDPEQPYRKWRGDYESLLKHYIRGDSWAYSDIRNINQQSMALNINVILILFLLKINFKLQISR